MKEGVSALLVCAALAAAAQSWAQPYPARPIRLIIPFGPGGTNDILGRLMAQKLTDVMRQQVIPDNRGGAGGSIGVEQAARAAPDGYTIVLGHIGTLAVNPTLYTRLAYDPLRDLDPITMIARLPNLMAVHPSVPAKSVSEFIALGKAKRGALSYGSGGTGGAGHLATEYFKLLVKIDMTHVPYRSTGLAVIDVLSGQLDMVFAGVPAIVPHTRTGKLRPLGVSGPTRLAVIPDIPTIAEAGVPGFNATQWYGLLAPARTPPAAMAVLHAAIAKSLSFADMKERFEADGAEPVITSGQEFRDFIKVEIARWAPVIKAAGIQQ
jgi:tripartite-type tricarboxylate transporter receptor subunit TctC